MADTTFKVSAETDLKDMETADSDPPRELKQKSTRTKVLRTASSTEARKQSSNDTTRPVETEAAPQKSPKPVKESKAVKSNNLTMLNMVIEALRQNKTVKGLSVQGIKRYIASAYPNIMDTFSNARLRKALLKGLEGNEIIRPKSSDDTGLKGYFLLNRTLLSQREKEKQTKIKEKKSTAKDSDHKVKKIGPKAGKSKRSASKSPLSKTKKSASKSPLPKTKKSGSKSPLPKRSASGSTSLKTKTLENKSPSASKRKVAKKKSQKKEANKLTHAVATNSRSHTPKATPKLSKSSRAGVRKKTAAVKKMIMSAE